MTIQMNIPQDLPPMDDEGYLIDPTDWNEQLAVTLAEREGIALTELHWDVIHFIRDYYQEHQVIPDVRFVSKYLAENLAAATRNTIFEMFPYGYVKQACRIAGMRRPRGWSTG